MSIGKIKIFFMVMCLLYPYNFLMAVDDEYIIPSIGNSSIFFSTWSIQTKYYNKNSNSDIIGNYLSGSYYSTTYGYFDFIDVSFVWSTSACINGYGYRLSGKAKSETGGFIDFWYNKNTFVYYCMNDSKLYGKAYMPSLWEQIFDGITFSILPNLSTPNLPTENTFFVNNVTTIFSNHVLTPGDRESTRVWADIQPLTHGQEVIFYIWKPKKK